jgi:DNA polymerase-3 subunit gamma/tau
LIVIRLNLQVSYQVLARKWRPQRFAEVIGQVGVTQTLRNAITSNRLAHAYVFAGPRGVGKTTTARILARALNCVEGPTPEPCGSCDACVEISAGRDIDVLEIDAATHTQVENVREVIIAGLAMAPVRDRYKIFLIDEVHQLSNHSFNALLKSIEEPPPHVIFMMATTELRKIPETIQSRSQVFKFRTISSRMIAEQLRVIAPKEDISIDESALALLARSAEGSMRDAQSALDQVIAFAGTTITVDDVAAVLGIVGRDLLLDIIEAVADEQGPVLFELAGRAVESGYDLRVVCRELSRLNRDLLLVSLDPSRITDPEISVENERERMSALAKRFSREDLMRAFDLLARAEAEIRTASQPRYHLEMALVKWMHLRKLVPLVNIINKLKDCDPSPSRASQSSALSPTKRTANVSSKSSSVVKRSSLASTSATSQVKQSKVKEVSPPTMQAADDDAMGLKDALLKEIQRSKKLLYGTVIAQAEKINVTPNLVTFTFAPAHRTLRSQLERNCTWISEIASKLSEQKVRIEVVESDSPSGSLVETTPQSAPEKTINSGDTLKKQVMKDEEVQAVLDVFDAEIREIEEI